MKRALRIIIPILLTIAIIACAVWYLMVYDRAFTRDLLLTGARSFEASGNHKIAAWLYDVAYYQSSNEDSVAIELAEQYMAIGNYTKAEYTLSQAISEKSSAALYRALCATYVKQDKLLDAVTLLDTITDPAIKAELDLARPEMPTVSPAPGFYTQYISVSVSASGGTLYVSADGQYPSIEKPPYSQPVTLPGGETMVYAVVVNDAKLVSPLGKFGYTIGGVIEEVSFADDAMEQAIRTALGVGSSKVLFSDDLWTITEFTVPEGTKDLSDLKHMTYLRTLTADGASAGQLSHIRSMHSLESLTLTNCRLNEEDLAAIGAMVSLKQLTIKNCGISTISALSNLTKLETLDLSGNTVRNLSSISGMTGLTSLNLSGNAANDLSDLSKLTALADLDVSYNNLSGLSPLETLISLHTINASHNQISGLPALGSLNQLSKLDLSHNALTDVSILADCKSLTTLDISNNALTDVGMLNVLTGLNKLAFAYNQVTTIPAFPRDAALVTIDGSHNLITSLEPLSNLQQLNNVLMDYNENLSTLRPLDSCPRLVQVNAYGTKVTEVAYLTQKSVIVNFNPIS